MFSRLWQFTRKTLNPSLMAKRESKRWAARPVSPEREAGCWSGMLLPGSAGREDPKSGTPETPEAWRESRVSQSIGGLVIRRRRYCALYSETGSLCIELGAAGQEMDKGARCPGRPNPHLFPPGLIFVGGER